MEEIWKEYPFDPRYKVSNFGQVKGQKGNILKGTKTEAGYKKVGLYSHGKGIFKYIHRMVLETFQPCDNSDNLQVNHKDGDKNNNTLTNLEWITDKQNKEHARDTLKISYSTEAAHKARQQKIKATNINTHEFYTFDSMKDCADYFKIPYQNIQYCIKNNKPNYKLQMFFEKI